MRIIIIYTVRIAGRTKFDCANGSEVQHCSNTALYRSEDFHRTVIIILYSRNVKRLNKNAVNAAGSPPMICIL